ncbi:protein-tyrosine phosphatase family protein [Algibacillus agarilyticus]|uniref:protein-tyrosine phosphatase family protein n=1 Tax=Algibacillus agarilyticus TaxID=2234133 RepID=UPI000DD0B9D8|nr:protein-tyrosine phosphatase family protein [Algibacillus agarilyticus]
MLPTIYKVINIKKGILSVMAKPVSGEWIEDEFAGLKRLGIDKVVCLLEKPEQIEVGLATEEELCIHNGIEFSSFPIPDRGLPDTSKAKLFVQQLYKEICSGTHIVVHCRAGIGRTGIIAGAILVHSGMPAKEALELISSARGVQVPDTEEQEEWLCSI